MVPEARLELARAKARRILSPLRLPIPPLRQNILLLCEKPGFVKICFIRAAILGQNIYIQFCLFGYYRKMNGRSEAWICFCILGFHLKQMRCKSISKPHFTRSYTLKDNMTLLFYNEIIYVSAMIIFYIQHGLFIYIDRELLWNFSINIQRLTMFVLML